MDDTKRAGHRTGRGGHLWGGSERSAPFQLRSAICPGGRERAALGGERHKVVRDRLGGAAAAFPVQLLTPGSDPELAPAEESARWSLQIRPADGRSSWPTLGFEAALERLGVAGMLLSLIAIQIDETAAEGFGDAGVLSLVSLFLTWLRSRRAVWAATRRRVVVSRPPLITDVVPQSAACTPGPRHGATVRRRGPYRTVPRPSGLAAG